ncbi:MAG: D-glycero-beta-D-manno-heptose-7-phosphate kinase [Candidatus Altiarchaeota archaeon]|nr:D-glycero-beta-D-manno-heptose-7-phosphate kinase [Candidatus Altiarchaeota archaeon]
MMPSNNASLYDILQGFKDGSVLVIGDLMLDKYIFGDVSRISPEAPVQIIDIQSESYVPGGAANVANNVAALGGTAQVVGVIGRDEEGEKLVSELARRGIRTDGAFVDDKRPTIQKVRVIGRNQQLLRMDFEDTKPMEADLERSVCDHLEKAVKAVDAVVVSDYAKGAVTLNLMENVIKLVRRDGKTLIVDPKPGHKSYYAGADLITPNSKEAGEMSGLEGGSDEEIEAMGKRLLEELNATVLITRGEKGMSLFQKSGGITHLPTKAKEVYDVSGAGDTVVGTLALSLSAGANITDAAILANHAAGITVGKLGTSTVSTAEIKKDLEHEQKNKKPGRAA